jgi:large subunit ribosomal protein L9
MKIILKEDIYKLGSLGDEVDVKRGFARNYLIPQGKALPLTRENIKQVVHHRQLLSKKRADAIEQAKAFAQKLHDTELVFEMKSGDSGKLFGSVTQKHIFDALVEQGIEIDRRKLHLSIPIKSVGTHLIPIKLHTEVSAQLSIKVVAEVEKQPSSNEESAEGNGKTATLGTAAGEPDGADAPDSEAPAS